MDMDEERFKVVVDEERKQHRMEYDDVTMLVIPVV